MSEGDETYDDHYVICPHCWHKHGDAWELTNNDDYEHERECDKCEKPFVCWSTTSVSYSARIKVPGSPP